MERAPFWGILRFIALLCACCFHVLSTKACALLCYVARIDTTDTNMGGKDPAKYPTKDNWVVGNTFEKNGGAITLGSVRL
eukprot:COSAG01_NODE_360_length_18184_cov_21.881780_11_plen_80_part_00